MSKIFLNIPDSVEEAISELDVEEFFAVYRAIRHTGDFVPEDFYPSFDDPYQKEKIQLTSLKGGMADIVTSHRSKTNFYSMSLFIDKRTVKDIFWRRHRRDFPVIAIGHTDSAKGIAHLDDASHVSYYLFDYKDENLNPYRDFKEDERADE